MLLKHARLPFRHPGIGPARQGLRDVVGAVGLEPTTSWPPAMRATKLRHAPMRKVGRVRTSRLTTPAHIVALSTRFELAISNVTGWHVRPLHHEGARDGVAGGIRTLNRRIHNPVLCR